ncbi:hypothetical protein [Streptomyces sp. ODS28]|uniref:cupin domain-containing protein n=1 Tax=Streptomyces sp. ODS28 TaxID=3136688 RepID=UPI0031EF68D5
MTDEPVGGPDTAGTPRVLCDTASLASGVPRATGALWRLDEPGRQLDANLVHVPPRERIASHTEPDLDALLLVVSGEGTLETAEGSQSFAPGALVWLPHGTARSLAAGRDGMTYLTVHRRRAGMQIRTRRPAD